MTTEDVSLDDLQGKIDLSTIPIWLRLLPTFLLALSAFDGLGLTAGRPGVATLLIPGQSYDGPSLAQVLIGELVTQAALLGGALVLRYKSPLAGMIRLKSRDQLFDFELLKHFVITFGTPDPAADQLARKRRMFIIFMAVLTFAGLALVNFDPSQWWFIPVLAAGWISVSLAVAWLGVFASSLRSSIGLLSLGAAGFISLLFFLGSGGFSASIQSVLIGLMIVGAAAAALTFIVTSDPSRERILRLRTTQGAQGGLYKLEPDPVSCGIVFLKLQLDETSPLLMFAADHGSNTFRPVQVDGNIDPIALHEKRVWIWNLRRLVDAVPKDIELRDRDDYIVASARVTPMLGSTTLAADAINDEVLMIAARRVLDQHFPATLEAELVSAFHTYADELIPDLSGLQSKLAYASIELSSMDQISAPASSSNSPVAKLHSDWKDLTLAVNTTLAKLKSGRSEAMELSGEWKRLIGERLTEGRGAERGLTEDEAQQIVALLALKVTIMKTELGPSALALKQQLTDLPGAIAGRFEEQRGWRKELILKLLSDPVTASQFADVLGKNPELLGAVPTRDIPGPDQDEGAGMIETDIPASGTPRNRN